jgi:hypothetical protein
MYEVIWLSIYYDTILLCEKCGSQNLLFYFVAITEVIIINLLV